MKSVNFLEMKSLFIFQSICEYPNFRIVFRRELLHSYFLFFSFYLLIFDLQHERGVKIGILLKELSYFSFFLVQCSNKLRIFCSQILNFLVQISNLFFVFLFVHFFEFCHLHTIPLNWVWLKSRNHWFVHFLLWGFSSL